MHASSDPEVVLAISTAPDAATAERLADALVAERLIACANLLPGVTSLFRWEGSVQREGEVLILMKTVAGHLPRLKARLPELHPYEVPELIAIRTADALEPYRGWVVAETGGAA